MRYTSSHQRPQRPTSWRKWLLLFGFLVGGCILPHHTPTHSREARCSSLPKAQITGWVDQLHDTCAALLQPGKDKGHSDRIIYVLRKLLPTGTKEGDFLHKGAFQPRPTRQAKAETLRLLQARPPLPRTFVVPGPPKPLARRKRYAPGTWRQFHNTRKHRRKQRKLVRFRRHPWRRLWRRKRATSQK